MENEKTSPEFIKVEGTDVFFYCDVSVESVAELCAAVKKIERDYYEATIRVHIHSEGGDLYAGLAAMDFLRSSRSRVVTIAEGICASAATLIFLGGDSRIVSHNAYLLIHQLGSDFWGKYENMKDEMLRCERLMKRMKRIYLRETTIPERKFEKLMKRDLYLSYRQCVKYGIHSVE